MTLIQLLGTSTIIGTILGTTAYMVYDMTRNDKHLRAIVLKGCLLAATVMLLISVGVSLTTY